jgi:hypothetical protein
LWKSYADAWDRSTIVKSPEVRLTKTPKYRQETPPKYFGLAEVEDQNHSCLAQNRNFGDSRGTASVGLVLRTIGSGTSSVRKRYFVDAGL